MYRCLVRLYPTSDAGCSIDRLSISIAVDTHGKDGTGWARPDLHALSRWQMSVNKLNNEGNSLYCFTFKWQSCGKLSAAPPEVLCLLCLFCSVASAKPAAQPPRLAILDGFFQWKAKKSPNKHPLRPWMVNLIPFYCAGLVYTVPLYFINK
jgi:hypothetical protein